MSPITSEHGPKDETAHVTRRFTGRRGPLLAARRWSEPRPIVEGDINPVTERREGVYRRLLALADVTAVLSALVVCVTIAGDDALRPASLLVAPLIVFAGKLSGLYDRDEHLVRKSTLDEAPRLFHLATLTALLIWLLEDALVAGQLGSMQVCVLWAATFSAMTVLRVAARKTAGRFVSAERCLVVGSPRTLEALHTKIDGRLPVVLVTHASLHQLTEEPSALHKHVAALDIHRLLISTDDDEHGRAMSLVRRAKAEGVRVSLIPSVLDVVGSSVEVEDLYGVTILGIPFYRLTRSSRVVKRAFDLVGATVALLVFSPVMLAAAAAIRLDSRGPALFRQTRIGRDGHSFQIIKFRSMVTGADEMKAALRALDLNEGAEGLFKMVDDPRITSVGRALRSTHLDELPQLLNVLRGDMSLVGPRPLVVEEDERITGPDRARLSLTPGMTGPWQLMGATRMSLADMAKADALYVSNWSLGTDVKVLLRTAELVLQRGGH